MKTYFPGPRNHRFLGLWTAPGAPDASPKGEALRNPPLGVVSGAAEAVQTPNIDDLKTGFHDYIKTKESPPPPPQDPGEGVSFVGGVFY